MQTIKDINGVLVEVSVNIALNISKGLVYVYGCNMMDFEAFNARIAEPYGVSSVVEATWIKYRYSNRVKQLLLTFTNKLPQYIDISREMVMTRARTNAIKVL